MYSFTSSSLSEKSEFGTRWITKNTQLQEIRYNQLFKGFLGKSYPTSPPYRGSSEDALSQIHKLKIFVPATYQGFHMGMIT